MILANVRDIFLTLLPDATFHYKAKGTPEQYIVWAEDGQAGSSHADDKMQNQAIEGTVDLFTKVEFDPLFDLIQVAMNNSDMTWELNSVQHEEDTGYIHYEWVWQICNEVGAT